VKDKVADGEKVLFVGTKRQIKEVVREEAVRCGMYHVTNRWLGGMLTNFQTIRKSIRRLKDLEQKQVDGSFEGLTKKEVQKLKRETVKLESMLGGIKEMDSLPTILFIVDAKKEKIAVNEARKLSIPIVAIVDTNSDPEPITIPIAGNDDAIRSVRLITSAVAGSVIEGSAIREARMLEAVQEKKDEEETVGEEVGGGKRIEAPDDVDVEEAKKRMKGVAKKVRKTRKVKKTSEKNSPSAKTREKSAAPQEAPPDAKAADTGGEGEVTKGQPDPSADHGKDE